MSEETEQQEFLSWDHEGSYLYAGGQPVCFHCHHYNLFIQETIDEALGAQVGARLRADASADAWRPVIEGFLGHNPDAVTPAQKIEAAFSLFAAMGQGKLVLDDASLEKGGASGATLHYSTAWRVIHGDEPARAPVDGVARGFITAAFEVAHALEAGALDCDQRTCTAMGDELNQFSITRRDTPRQPFATIDRAQMEAHKGKNQDSLEEEEVDRISRDFRAMLAQVTCDERGLVEGFGILVTVTPTAYYNRVCAEMLEHLHTEHPRLLEVSEQLLYEAGRLCGFNTFGGVLRSPEWEALLGRARSKDPKETLIHASAIARSFGFGKWGVHEYIPEDFLVLRAPATYEDPFVREIKGTSRLAVCYLFTGAGEAMVRLAEEVIWDEDPDFGLDYYERAVKKSDAQWRAKQTQSRSRGDDYVEVTVEP